MLISFIVLSNFKSELNELTMWVRTHENHCSLLPRFLKGYWIICQYRKLF